MASRDRLGGFRFDRINPSPTNPHKPPKAIRPIDIHHPTSKYHPQDRSEMSGGVRFNPHLDSSSTEQMQVNGGPFRDHTQIDIEERPTTSTSLPPVDPGNTDGKEKEKEIDTEKKLWWCKMISGVIVIIVAIVGSVYFILYYTHPNVQEPQAQLQTDTTPTPDTTQTQKECIRSKDEIRFKDILQISCTIKLDENYQLNRISIFFNPKYGSYLPIENLIFNLSENEISKDGWNISVGNDPDNAYVNLTKEPAKCDSGGHYDLEFNATNGKQEKIVLKHGEYIEIKRKISSVSLHVLQNNSTDTSDSYYAISCSAQSDCTPAPIALLGIFNNGNDPVPIFGVNFTCIINYNDNDGWTVKCTGTIPANVYSSLNSIACRPTTGNATIDEESEISYDICKDCIFKCPEDDIGDRYWYDYKICNIFHRCVNGRQYTHPCPPKTYFNSYSCSCDHTDNLPGKCDENNERVTQKSKTYHCE